jgi:DinB superfamily
MDHMDPADLLQPLEGQRAETLRVLDSLTAGDMDVVVKGDGRTVQQILFHLADRERGISSAIRRALEGEVHVSRPEAAVAPADWDLVRVRAALAEAREGLRQTFQLMAEDDLDRPIRWQEWPARTIRTSIPYVLEHEDSHLDELRAAVERERKLVG